ncbi:MAG: hypothetical protein VSS75_025475 [Candidatus Parabeggiatoa sp.]|nr:hypothetical protein [Candidatus Parabeggiatoa sp.]
MSSQLISIAYHFQIETDFGDTRNNGTLNVTLRSDFVSVIVKGREQRLRLPKILYNSLPSPSQICLSLQV